MTISSLRTLGLMLLAMALLVGLVAPAAIGAPIVQNGSFETGNRAGWTVSNMGSGNWKVYDDPEVIENSAIKPPHGQYAIATSQSGPGSHVLSQKVRLPKGVRLRLKFALWYNSQAPITVAPTLRHDAGAGNQQLRIDVIKPGANARTLNPDAILATVYRTRVGDPQTIRLKGITKKLTRLGGRTVRLRFAEVDNLGNFNVVIDRVRIVIG